MGLIAMLFAGVLYAWSILKAPLAASFGWTPSDLGLSFTLTMCFFCVGGVVSGFLTRKVSPKLSLAVGAFLACGGFIITSRLSAQNLLLLYVAYGGMSGLGIGIAYNAIIVTVNAWFPDRKGM
jgi:OFA family oxalate/formate antiporter-like MFS transporter